MDVQLQELINKIKEEGIQSAEEQGAEIVDKAEEKARDIVSAAEAKAESIIANAKSDADKLERTGQDALANAGRDLILSVQSRLEDIFKNATGNVIGASLQKDTLDTAIVNVVSAMAAPGSLNVQVSPSDADRILSAVTAKLADAIKEGLEIQPVEGISAGFRMAEKDGSSYLDFTDKGIAEMLSQFLNPKFAAILNGTSAKE